MQPSQATEAAAGCMLCGAPARALYEAMQDRICGTVGTWSIRRCDACNLAWLDGPVPGNAHGDGYYTHDNGDEALRALAEVPRSAATSLRELGYAAGRAEHAAGRLLNLIPHWRDRAQSFAMYLPAVPGGRLLDVGCGAGVFAARMRSLGWDVECVEPDPQAAAVARRVFGLTVHDGELADAPAAACDFDAITMGHVIEHVPDPIAALSEAGRRLKPDGVMAVVTPNIDSMGARYFGRDWMHWDVPRHRYLFSPQSLAATARRAGLGVIGVRSTARTARWAWRRSRELRRAGRVVERGNASARGVDAVAFEAVEATASAWSHAGEECVLMAGRGS